jgi:hypothetical protein
MWSAGHHVVWCVGTNVSNEHSTSAFSVELLTINHTTCITDNKSQYEIFITIKTSNLTWMLKIDNHDYHYYS